MSILLCLWVVVGVMASRRVQSTPTVQHSAIRVPIQQSIWKSSTSVTQVMTANLSFASATYRRLLYSFCRIFQTVLLSSDLSVVSTLAYLDNYKQVIDRLIEIAHRIYLMCGCYCFREHCREMRIGTLIHQFRSVCHKNETNERFMFSYDCLLVKLFYFDVVLNFWSS